MRFAEYAPGRRARSVSARIRPAAVADVARCAELAVPDPRLRAAWRARSRIDLAGARGALLVAEVSGAVVGYGRAAHFVRPSRAAPDIVPDGFYLAGLAVAEDFRRAGLGRRLTEARMRWVAERAERVWYVANARNRASIALHAAFGFVEVTRDFRYPGVTFEGGRGVLFAADLPE